MKGLIEGRIVHYMPAEDDTAYHPNPVGHHYAAIVVCVVNHRDGLSRLFVFNFCDQIPETRFGTYSNLRGPGTWHWPEKV